MTYLCPHNEHPADCERCGPGPRGHDVNALRSEVYKLRRLLDHRDAFIVERCGPGPRGHAVDALRSEVCKLRRLLDHRDAFIVKSDLWHDFLCGLALEERSDG